MQKKHALRILTLVLVVLFSNLSQAQQKRDTSYLFELYYGIGGAVPVGTWSKHSSAYNAFGKASVGFNIKTGINFFFSSGIGISLDLDYALFSHTTNDSLSRYLSRRAANVGPNGLSNEFTEIDVTIANVAIGISRLYRFKKLIVHPKVSVGRAKFGYDFMASYLTYTAPSPSQAPLTGFKTVDYYFNDVSYLTAKPEIMVKYIFAEKKYADLLVGICASYFYLKPTMPVNERKNGQVTQPFSVSDKIQCFNVSLSAHLVIKRTAVKKIKTVFSDAG
jgi:hypothetical protein